MPLPRHQIRNEYSLADPELYRAADKDDPEALLEGVAMAGLVGVLRQLGDLAEFAAEIFHDLHEEVMATSARGHGLMVRVQQLEAEFPSIEKEFLSQTNHSSFFYNTGVDWHPNLRMDQSLITQGDLPRFVMDSYEECRGPPQLFLLDKFDVAGAGACLKRYTDPSFFKVDSSSSGMTNAKVQREKKIRKAKKKGSHWRNGGTPEVLTTSNAKLHQLFLEESVENHINDPARRVKLKRRLNGFPFGSKTGKSYMEQFLESPTPDSNVREISVNLSPLKLPSNITGESGIEVLEISTVSPDKELAHPCSSPDVEETGRKPTIDELSEEVKYGISEVPGLNPISEADNVLSTLHEDVDEKEIAVDGERKIEGSVDGYQSDDIASEVDNYMDALTTMDSEMETDTECKAKNDLHFLNVENQGIDSDANEEQRDIQAHFSDSQSIGNSTATDDGNSPSKKGLFSFSFSDSLSNSTENMPSDGDVSAKALQSTEICEFEIVNMASDRHTVNEESPLTQAPKHMVCDGVCNDEADIPSYRPEFAEPSSISCHADSTPMLVPVDPVKSLMECSSVEPELDEISSNNELNTKYSNLEENTAYLGENLPCTSNLSDSPSQTRDDFPPELSSEHHHADEFDDEDPHTLSHASQQLSNILEPAAHGKNSNESLVDDSLQAEYAEDECPEISVDIQIDSPHSVASHAEEQHLDSAFPELETCHPDMKPDGIVSKVDDAPPMPEEKAISSTPTVDNLEATSFTKQQFLGISENISPHELDSAEVGFSYSREKNLDAASNAADCEESGGFSTDMDIIGKDDSSLKFSPDFQSSPDPPPVPNVHLDDVVTETVHSEVVIVATAVVGSHCDDNEDDSKSFTTSPTKLQEESITILEDLHQNGMEINGACSPEHLQESCTEKEVDQQAVASSNLDSVLCNTVSCDDSNSEFLNSVIDSSKVATSRNSLHIADATTVPLSSDQHDQDSESKSAQKINAIEIAEDTVSSPTHHNAELKMHIADATTVLLSSDQHDQDSVSKSAQKINAIEIAEDTVSSPIHHNAELRTPLEQKVELQDDQFDVESWGEQDSESKSALQIHVVEKAEDAASSPTHHIAELTTPLEQKIDLQDDQFDVEYWHADKASSEPFSLVDQIQSPNYLDQERYTDASSEFCAAQPPLSEFFPQLDVSEQAKDSGLLPEVSQINLDEMPPLPPLPPMQWRLGKVQNASLASERDFVGHNQGSFPPILPSTADAKTQLCHPAIVSGGAPQLITIGADKTLAILDTISFKELRRIKPVPKLACHSVASWCHPRAPNLDILTCVKDSHIWAIEHPTYSALTRPLCELSSLVPPQVLASQKKLRVFCMVVHPLQPHLVATGSNVGIISEFDPKSLPALAPLPTPPGSREHSAVYVVERELKLLQFQLSNTANPSLGSNGSLAETGRFKGDSFEQLHVKQIKKHISTPVPHDSYSVLSVSSSGKYLAIVWPDIPYFSIYKVSDWSVVDSGSARHLAWDTCRDRFALLESALPPRIPIIPKGGSSKKAREAAAAAAAQVAAAAATVAASASVQVRILLDDGTSNILMRSVGSRTDPVIGLHGGALLGVVYRTSRRVSPVAATAISTIQSMPLSGFGTSGLSSFATMDDGLSSQRSPTEAAPQNFQLYSWETFQPVGGLLPQPEWTAWDQTVEYCAFAYQQYIVISSLRPQYRYLGDVAIPHATGAVWHRRQLFVATPTTIECVFVDAGVAPIDIETKKRKEEMKLREAQARAVSEHGELALIAVDGLQTATQERIALRPPMLQVVRLASFQYAPSVPPFLSLPKQSKVGGDESAMLKETEERRVNEVAVGGGGVSVAVTRFPAEQKRPVGPLIVVGVRDGVLWLIDRYMCAHAISLSHPGIRCRCLAAYGDAVSAVKWASRLGREHHDDLAQFMLGMGYATEALHLPGISKRLEFDLAMQSNDLKRALQCLLTMTNSRDIGQETVGLDLNDILSLTDKKENIVDAVQGVVKFANEFLELIDAADATAQGEIAREAIKRLAAAGSVKGALRGQELRGLALRLANHGELTRLSNLVNNMISVGSGREAAFAAAVLGDNTLMEKAWQETGMLAEAVLHAHAHGRPTLRNLVQAWNKMLQKEMEHTPSTKTDAAAAFLASLEGPKLTSLADAAKKLPIEILPPGMASLYAPNPGPKKPSPATQGQQPGKPMLLEAPPADTDTDTDTDTAAATAAAAAAATSAPPPSEPSGPPPSESSAPPSSDSSASVPSESGAPPPSESSAPAASELSAPTTDNQTPSSVGVMDLIVPATTSSQAMPEAPNLAPDIQGTNGPATAPMIDFS